MGPSGKPGQAPSATGGVTPLGQHTPVATPTELCVQIVQDRYPSDAPHLSLVIPTPLWNRRGVMAAFAVTLGVGSCIGTRWEAGGSHQSIVCCRCCSRLSQGCWNSYSSSYKAFEKRHYVGFCRPACHRVSLQCQPMGHLTSHHTSHHITNAELWQRSSQGMYTYKFIMYECTRCFRSCYIVQNGVPLSHSTSCHSSLSSPHSSERNEPR